jgi:hypothetical protein
MTKRAKNILLIAALGAAYYFSRIIAAARKLHFSLGRITNFSLKGNAVSWTQYINVRNGDPVSIPVTSVNLFNYVGGQNIGSSILEGGTFWIPARGTGALPIRIHIPLIDLAMGVQAVINMIKNGTFTMRLEGTISSFGATIPLNQSFQFTIPKF